MSEEQTPETEMYRTSPLQERLWRARPGGPPWAACVLHADRRLDRDALETALRGLAARHSILRTGYRELPTMEVPVQVIGERPEVAVTEVELIDPGAGRRWTAAFLDGTADDFRDAELTHPPLLRTTLARAEGGDLLGLALPALSADPRTLELIARELGAGYEGAATGEPDEAFDYLDFSEWHHELREDEEEMEEAREHWRRIVPEPPACGPLPGQRTAAEEVTGTAGEVTGTTAGEVTGTIPLALAPGLGERLKTAAGEVTGTAAGEVTGTDEAGTDEAGTDEAADEADLLLAGWLAFVARVTGDREVVVGRLEDGRDHELLESAAGLFARHLPLHLRPDPRLSLRELARRVATARAEAVEHGDFFEPPAAGFRDTVGFRHGSWPAAIDAGDATLRPAGWRAPLEPFTAELATARVGDELRAELLCDPRRLPPAAARYLGRLAAAFLDAALRAPDAPLGTLPLLPAAERHQLAVELAGAAGTAADAATVPELFARRVAEDPSAPAVVSGTAGSDTTADGELSFGELAERSRRLARRLRRLGVGPEVVVGLYLERSPELIVGLLAILEAGGAYLPMDPLYPPGRLRTMLELSGARLVVGRRRGLELLGDLGDRRTFCLNEEAEAIAAGSAEPLDGGPAPRNLAYVLFTSGSTGRPKGVMVEHRSVAHLAAALEERIYRSLGPGRLRVGLNAPLVFDASVKQWIQLLAGHTLHLVPEEVRPDPARFLAHATDAGLDVVDGTPSQIAPMLDAGLGDPDRPGPRTVLVGGEAIDAGLWRRLAGRSGASFWNLYGPTECTVDATAAPIQGDTPRLGRPLRDVRVALLDRRGEPVPRGVAGELHLGGGGVARGYAAAPALTADRFRPDPWSAVPGSRLYRTGDRARRSLAGDGLAGDGLAGEIEFLGRVDHQVKVRGFRIELGEIEAVLRRHPGVREAVVDLRSLAGEEERHLMAWIVPAGDKAGDGIEGELREHLRERLPEFMVPAFFVPLDRLPLNRNGKVDRPALPLPADSDRQRHAEYLAPRNRIEAEIAEVWQRVLGVEKVGANDNFFDLGGHSLLLLQVFEALRDRFDGDLTMVEMFNHPTVAALAERLGEEKPATALDGVQDRIEKQRLARERQRRAMKKLGGGP